MGVRSSERADLVQETVWRAYRSAPRSSLNARALLTGIARRVFGAWAQRRREEETALSMLASHAPPPRPDELVERLDDVRRLRSALLSLADVHLETVLAVLDVDEERGAPVTVARAFHLPVPTIYTRLRLGYEQLRALLALAAPVDR
jgi:DNA-directed RNA polymerase specialized sigma24 family protein